MTTDMQPYTQYLTGVQLTVARQVSKKCHNCTAIDCLHLNFILKIKDTILSHICIYCQFTQVKCKTQ